MEFPQHKHIKLLMLAPNLKIHFMKSMLIVIGCCWLALQKAAAQSPVDLERYRSKYGAADAVFLEFGRVVNVTLQEDSFTIYEDDIEDLLLLGNNVNRYSESSVGYSELIDLVSLEAKTLVPEKNKYRTVPVREIVTEKSLEGSIFYDDFYERKIYFNALQPGARRFVQSRQQVKLPQLLSAFFFQSYAPCTKSYYEITTSSEVEIAYRLFHVPDGAVQYSVSEANGTRTHRWEYSEVPALAFPDDDAPGMRHYMPHLTVRIAGYKTAEGNHTIMASADDLYRWYYGFIRVNENRQSTELKPLVDSITAGLKSDDEKAGQILRWVQDHIRYVAFEVGLQGFIPRPATTVCSKRFGDCKDMASVLVAMLRLAGLEAHFTWIGTREIPYTYEEVPSPLADNHMIAAVRLKGKHYFLDATSNYLAYDLPSSFIQGKEALIALDSTNYLVRQVPEVDAARNLEVDSFTLRLNDKILKGSGIKEVEGYPAQRYAYFLSSLHDDNRKGAMENRLRIGNNKYRLDSFALKIPESFAGALRISSSFSIADYSQQAGDEIYVNLNLQRPFYNNFLDTALRKLDREFEYQIMQKQWCSLQIPQGYEVEYLPPAASFRNKQFRFDVTYVEKGGAIVMERNLAVETLLLRQSSFAEWNKMISTLNSSYSEAIILRKKS